MNIDVIKRRVLGAKVKLLLDDFPNAAVACSLRLLNSQYTGDCIEVRRSSDDTTQNIGFVNRELDTASLLSFVGAGDGFVRTWYDQSGNGRNLLQTTFLKQLLIVSDGNIIINNSLPAMQTNGLTSCGFNTLSRSIFRFTHESQATWSVVCNPTSTGIFSRSNQANPALNQIGVHLSSSTPTTIMNGSGTNYVIRYNITNFTTLNTTNQILWDYDLTEPDAILRSTLSRNNVVVGQNTAVGNASVANSNNDLSFIGIPPSADTRFYVPGKYQEYVIWDVRYNSKRGIINNNINAYYNIF
jgi:hypothetical protein